MRFTLPGRGVASIFTGGPKIAVPPPPPPPPARDDPEVLAARKRLREREAIRKGRSANILQGGEGVLGEPAAIARPEATTLG